MCMIKEVIQNILVILNCGNLKNIELNIKILKCFNSNKKFKLQKIGFGVVGFGGFFWYKCCIIFFYSSFEM